MAGQATPPPQEQVGVVGGGEGGRVAGGCGGGHGTGLGGIWLEGGQQRKLGGLRGSALFLW